MGGETSGNGEFSCAMYDFAEYLLLVRLRDAIYYYGFAIGRAETPYEVGQAVDCYTDKLKAINRDHLKTLEAADKERASERTHLP